MRERNGNIDIDADRDRHSDKYGNGHCDFDQYGYEYAYKYGDGNFDTDGNIYRYTCLHTGQFLKHNCYYDKRQCRFERVSVEYCGVRIGRHDQ